MAPLARVPENGHQAASVQQNLSGVHAPSPTNMRIDSKFFGVNSHVLFSHPAEFRSLIDGNHLPALEVFRNSDIGRTFIDTSVIGARSEGAPYLVIYDRYQYSSIYSGPILRSAFCIYQRGDFLNHYYVERFANYEAQGKRDYVFKYHGLAFCIAEPRLSIDFVSALRNEMTFTSFAPVQRSFTRFLFGVASAIAATIFRQPFATKVALLFRGDGLIGKEQLKCITELEPVDTPIPGEVLQFLDTGGDMIRIS
jgi:hypothetical protein